MRKRSFLGRTFHDPTVRHALWNQSTAAEVVPWLESESHASIKEKLPLPGQWAFPSDLGDCRLFVEACEALGLPASCVTPSERREPANH